MSPQDSQSLPLEHYHGVPSGWSKAELIAEHRRLGGLYSIDAELATEPGAPAFLPDRENWLQYRATLYRIAAGARSNDLACIELAIRYLELNYIGSYSGFIREKLSRALKSAAATLTREQKQRLKRHFASLVGRQECRQEFGEYRKLLKRINESEPENG